MDNDAIKDLADKAKRRMEYLKDAARIADQIGDIPNRYVAAESLARLGELERFAAILDAIISKNEARRG